VRHGQLAGGLYVGPPGTAKAFTKLLQQPVDLGPLRAELRAGRLQGLAQRLAQT
jgi:nitrite reductase (NADH) large subunit